MARIFYDGDISLDPLDGHVVAVIGYGNQGRSQALNMRDSGLSVIVGNPRGPYAEQAEKDGLPVFPIEKAVSRADIIMLIIPDEIQPQVYQESVEPNLKEQACLVFSHGFNIFYDIIRPPETVDVVLVAPRMLGVGVRTTYLRGDGFPALVAVEQDATRTAWPRALAIAKAIGGAKKGAWETTFEEETVIDLFGEQVGGGSTLAATINSFETLVEAGYDPEVVLLELYASGEMVEVMRSIVREGLLDSLTLHSPTSQYGQLSRARQLVPEEAKETLRVILGEIRDGSFAREWVAQREDDYEKMDALRARFAKHEMFQVEKRVKKALLGDPDDDFPSSTTSKGG
jgi:ketol-acid reductoisomerase